MNANKFYYFYQILDEVIINLNKQMNFVLLMKIVEF
jgi:hypothetical protein